MWTFVCLREQQKKKTDRKYTRINDERWTRFISEREWMMDVTQYIKHHYAKQPSFTIIFHFLMFRPRFRQQQSGFHFWFYIIFYLMKWFLMCWTSNLKCIIFQFLVSWYTDGHVMMRHGRTRTPFFPLFPHFAGNAFLSQSVSNTDLTLLIQMIFLMYRIL